MEAPVEAVWADLSDIASHVEWMGDVDAIRFTTVETTGVGAAYEVGTRLGPIRLRDTLEVSDWKPKETLAVRRGGVVGGEGRFTLEAVDSNRTLLTRDMHLRFPWWLGGPVGERVAAPVLRALFAANLAAFAARHIAG